MCRRDRRVAGKRKRAGSEGSAGSRQDGGTGEVVRLVPRPMPRKVVVQLGAPDSGAGPSAHANRGLPFVCHACYKRLERGRYSKSTLENIAMLEATHPGFKIIDPKNTPAGVGYVYGAPYVKSAVTTEPPPHPQPATAAAALPSEELMAAWMGDEMSETSSSSAALRSGASASPAPLSDWLDTPGSGYGSSESFAESASSQGLDSGQDPDLSGADGDMGSTGGLDDLMSLDGALMEEILLSADSAAAVITPPQTGPITTLACAESIHPWTLPNRIVVEADGVVVLAEHESLQVTSGPLLAECSAGHPVLWGLVHVGESPFATSAGGVLGYTEPISAFPVSYVTSPRVGGPVTSVRMILPSCIEPPPQSPGAGAGNPGFPIGEDMQIVFKRMQPRLGGARCKIVCVTREEGQRLAATHVTVSDTFRQLEQITFRAHKRARTARASAGSDKHGSGFDSSGLDSTGGTQLSDEVLASPLASPLMTAKRMHFTELSASEEEDDGEEEEHGEDSDAEGHDDEQGIESRSERLMNTISSLRCVARGDSSGPGDGADRSHLHSTCQHVANLLVLLHEQEALHEAVSSPSLWDTIVAADGSTIAHIAAKLNLVDVLEQVVPRGCRLDAVSADGTPLDVALQAEAMATVSFIRDHMEAAASSASPHTDDEDEILHQVQPSGHPLQALPSWLTGHGDSDSNSGVRPTDSDADSEGFSAGGWASDTEFGSRHIVDLGERGPGSGGGSVRGDSPQLSDSEYSSQQRDSAARLAMHEGGSRMVAPVVMPVFKVCQRFGGGTEETTTEADTLTTLAFDRSGDVLATGDAAGRVVLFKRHVQRLATSPDSHGDSPSAQPHQVVKFGFLAEFQSHLPSFDYLKSVEIEPAIRELCWLPQGSATRSLLTVNDKSIRLWRLRERAVKVARPHNGHIRAGSQLHSGTDLQLPRLEEVGQEVLCKMYAEYGKAHAYHINSVSVAADGELFLSADDLRVNLWHPQHSHTALQVVDIKPVVMEELSEVITSACFSPTSTPTFAYATSAGSIQLADLRSASLCEAHTKEFSSQKQLNSFFAEIVQSVSRVTFSQDGRRLIARDCLGLKVYDTRREGRPLFRVNTQSCLVPRLAELYESDRIFDRFSCSVSPDDKFVVTGSYGGSFSIVNCAGTREVLTQLPTFGPGASSKGRSHEPGQVGSTMERLLKAGQLPLHAPVLSPQWNPVHPCLAVPHGASLYIYNQRGQC